MCDQVPGMPEDLDVEAVLNQEEESDDMYVCLYMLYIYICYQGHLEGY